jgi:predicted membrane chloride channel (bestrophin family)
LLHSGSALFKSLTPAIFSNGIFLVLYNHSNVPDNFELLSHPYPMGALISALTFLLAFRANFSYKRYWEAYGAVYQMHSKWLDVAMELAAFHLQSSAFDAVRPPAYGSHPHLLSMQRERERLNEYSLEDMKTKIESMEASDPTLRERVTSALTKQPSHPKVTTASETKPKSKSINARPTSLPPKKKKSMFRTIKKKLRGAKKRMVTIETAKVTPEAWPEGCPPLFLQELAHLMSLLSAVALSTLRNDLEQAESPLIPFTPGEPWPHVDPDSYGADVRKDWATTTHKSWTVVRYALGLSRTPGARTLYNAARPFRVIGGISDAEIELLQAARGPLAKYALCTMWITEFISREYLNGSTGNVAPPIISRLYQCLSDGGLGYNHARKIAYTPFPFPHAQITSLFIFILVGFLPVLMLVYLNNFAFAFCLNFLTVLCFTGVHEVARELENPFQNVPNDVPVNNFQAQYNEALMTMFFGYHPDSYWQIKRDEDVPHSPSSIIQEEDDRYSLASGSTDAMDSSNNLQALADFSVEGIEAYGSQSDLLLSQTISETSH